MLLKDMLNISQDKALVYLEQNVNYLFQKGERKTEVLENYLPDTTENYQMPFVWINKNNPKVSLFRSEPSENLLNQVFNQDLIKFFIHPGMISEYEQNNVEFMNNVSENVLVSPTASTRTVMTQGFLNNFMIKTNMTQEIGGLKRKMKKSTLLRSHEVMNEMILIENLAPKGFAYLPESLGVVYDDEIGMILREIKSRPFLTQENYLIPFFSLISKDRKCPNDLPLLCQLIENIKGNSFEAFVEFILRPLLESWSYVLFERGLMPIVHFQNILLEIDTCGQPVRVVYRDLQDIMVDDELRCQNGLESNFTGHTANDVEHRLLVVDNRLITDPQEARKIRYSLNYDFWAKRIFDALSVVVSKYSSCSKDKIQDAIKDIFAKPYQNQISELFPKNCYEIIGVDPNNPRLRYLETRGEPKYR